MTIKFTMTEMDIACLQGMLLDSMNRLKLVVEGHEKVQIALKRLRRVEEIDFSFAAISGVPEEEIKNDRLYKEYSNLQDKINIEMSLVRSYQQVLQAMKELHTRNFFGLSDNGEKE